MEIGERVLAKGIFLKSNYILVFFYVLTAFLFIFGLISGDAALCLPCCIGALFSFLAASFFWHLFSHCELTVTNRRVFGKAAFGLRVDLPIDMISSVGTVPLEGICVATSSGRIKFYLCKNREQVFEAISKRLTDRQRREPMPVVQPVVRESITDELTKYKKLLDDGVITQEEFNAKKKQLLGL